MNTNFWDVVVILLYFAYLLASFAGAAYLVAACGWSAWWMIFPAAFMSVRFRTGKIDK